MSSSSSGANFGSMNNVSGQEYDNAAGSNQNNSLVLRSSQCASDVRPALPESSHLGYSYPIFGTTTGSRNVSNAVSSPDDADNDYKTLGTLYLNLLGYPPEELPVPNDRLTSSPGKYIVFPHLRKGMSLRWQETQGVLKPVFDKCGASIASCVSANHPSIINDYVSQFHRYFCQARNNSEQSRALSRKVQLRYNHLWQTIRGGTPAHPARRNDGRKWLMKEFLYDSTKFRHDVVKSETARWVKSLYDTFHDEVVKSGTGEKDFTYEMVYFKEDFMDHVEDGSDPEIDATLRPLNYEKFWRGLEQTYGDRLYEDVVHGGAVRPVLRQ